MQRPYHVRKSRTSCDNCHRLPNGDDRFCDCGNDLKPVKDDTVSEAVPSAESPKYSTVDEATATTAPTTSPRRSSSDSSSDDESDDDGCESCLRGGACGKNACDCKCHTTCVAKKKTSA
jgi:hypothetical protein